MFLKRQQYHRTWLKWAHVWQNMYQIDYGLMCSFKVPNTVIHVDNIYIGMRNADFVWQSVPIKSPLKPINWKLICKLRLSSHCLCIETGRYKNVPLERRICPMCKSDVEDEYHFMLKCPAYNNLRKKIHVFEAVLLSKTLCLQIDSTS